MSDMRRMIKFWTNENPGKPGSKQYKAAVQRTITKFINEKNAEKGKELLNKALKVAKGKKTKKKKTKKKRRKGGKRKSMKRNKRSRGKRRGRRRIL